MSYELNFYKEQVFEAKRRFAKAGKLGRYRQMMKKFKKMGMTPMEAFKTVCLEKEMRPENTDKIIAFREKVGRIKAYKGS